MAPTKPNYNSVLTRANQSRDKVLQDTGGLVEEPEVTEFNLADYGITFPSPEDYDRFARDFITKSGEKLTIKGPRPKSQQKLFNALNATGVSPQGSEQQAPLPRTKMSDEPIPLLQQGMLGEAPAPLDQEEALRKGYQYLTRDSRRVGDFSLFSTDNAPTPSFQPEMPEEAPLDMEAAAQPSEAQARLFQAIQETGKAPMTPLKPSPETAAGEGMTGLSPTQERLNALASILKMTEGDEAARRKAYERTAMDAETGKIMQAMMAGLTRSPVPANVYEPTPAYQPEGRLSLLAKAAQALRGMQDVTSTGASGAGQNRFATENQKLWLKNNEPDLYKDAEEAGTLDTMTEAEWRKYFDGHQAKLKGERTAEQQELNRKEREEREKERRKQDTTKFISKLSDKAKNVVEIIPNLERLRDNPELARSVLNADSNLAQKIGQGLALNDMQAEFNSLEEAIVGPYRRGQFGLSQTAPELQNFDRQMARGALNNPVLRLVALRDLLRSMRANLQNTWSAAESQSPDSEIYKQFKAIEDKYGKTHNAAIWDELDNSLSNVISNAPSYAQTPVGKIKQTGKALLNRITAEEPGPSSKAPVEEDRIEPMPSQAAPTPAGGLSPEKQKRLEELRRKKAQGTLGE